MATLRGENPPLVAISILNWNGWQDTLECVESVRRLDYPNYLTVVVDNGSWDDSAEQIKAWAKENLGPGQVLADYSRETALAGGDPETEQALDHAPCSARTVLIRTEENLGFTGGNNVTIHYALTRKHRAVFVFLLNNDAVVDGECVRELVHAERHADAGIVGACVLEQGSEQVLFGGIAPMMRQFFSPLLRWQLPPPDSGEDMWESQVVSGTGMLIRCDVLERLHEVTGEYLKEGLFLYGEELALASLALRQGFKSIVAKRGMVYHRPVRANGKLVKALCFYYGSRNRILLARLILPFPLRLLFHPLNLALALASVPKKLVNHRTLEARAIVSGVIDGYRGVSGKWKWHDREFMAYRAAGIEPPNEG
jgi:GT2 family glycosyltransferase